MFQSTFLLLISCYLSLGAVAQTPVKITQQPAATQPSYAFKKLNPNLAYAFIIDKPGNIHPQEGDQITVKMQSVFNNNVLFNTAMVFKRQCH